VRDVYLLGQASKVGEFFRNSDEEDCSGDPEEMTFQYRTYDGNVKCRGIFGELGL
jgi:hypothetical protein